MTLKEAFELSIEKWKWIVGNDGSSNGFLKALPHLRRFPCECGLCGYYRMDCPKCNINDNLMDGCNVAPHKWHSWYLDKTKANAQAVLDLIKEKYNEYLEQRCSACDLYGSMRCRGTESCFED